MKATLLCALGLGVTVSLANAQITFGPGQDFTDLNQAIAAAAASNPDEDVVMYDDWTGALNSITYTGTIRGYVTGFPAVSIQSQPIDFSGATFQDIWFTPHYSPGLHVYSDASFIRCDLNGTIEWDYPPCTELSSYAVTVDNCTVNLTDCSLGMSDWTDLTPECFGQETHDGTDALLKVSGTYGELNLIGSLAYSSPGFVSDAAIIASSGTTVTFDECDIASYALPALNTQSGVTVDIDGGVIESDLDFYATDATIDDLTMKGTLSTLLGECTITGGKFEDAGLYQVRGINYYDSVTFESTTVDARAQSGSVAAVSVDLIDCIFDDSNFIYKSRTDNSNTMINCLFVNQSGNTILLDGDANLGNPSGNGVDFRFDKITIAECTGIPFLVTGYADYVEIVNSVLWNPSADNEVSWNSATGGTYVLDDITVYDGEDGIDGGGNYTITDVYEEDPLFCDPSGLHANRIDFALRWDSPCYDKDGDSMDFDLTEGDLGWRPVYDTVELTSVTNNTIEAGHYTISSTRSLGGTSLTIEPGAVIVVDEGLTLDLYSTSGDLSIGDPSSQRTAIVSNDAYKIQIGHVSNLVDSDIDGVLFNHAPEYGLVFSHLNELQLNADPESNTTVQIQNMDGGQLMLLACEASEVIGFTFDLYNGDIDESPHRFDRLSLPLGDNNYINDCAFIAGGQSDALFPLAIVSSTDVIITSCLFKTTEDVKSCLVSGYATVSFGANQFQDLDNTAIDIRYGAVDLETFAHNDFYGVLNDANTPAFITMEAGDLLMKCGYNNLVYTYLGSYSGFDFIQSQNHSGPDRNWMKNYWGSSESSALDCEDVADRIPSWADGSNCLADFDPPATPCIDDDEDEGLYSAGLGAEANNNELLAIWYYKEVCRLYPESGKAPYAAARLKELGKDDPDWSSPAKSGLLVGSEEADEDGNDWLSITEYCHAQCVEAYYGDRDGALDLLDSLIVLGDSLSKALAEFAKLEIDTYPKQGGGSALMGLAHTEQSARTLQSVDALLSFATNPVVARQEESRLETQPGTFKLASVWPNPFNPTTTIGLWLAQEDMLNLSVYNLLGQRVAELHNGQLEAGEHTFLLDGASLASGVYVVSAKTAHGFDSKKVLLLK